MGDAADPHEMKKTFLMPAIKPLDHYDFSRAKIACSLRWLVAKAFGTQNMPEELKEPFYRDQYDQERIKPPLVSLLLSAELYCRVWCLILKTGTMTTLLGHDGIIQALAQKGLYVTDKEKLVTERDLHKKPIEMNAHLAMIDTLMMAYTEEMIGIKKVIVCVQQYSDFFQDTDLPYDIESAIIYWINKVNEHLKDIVEQQQKSKELHKAEVPGVQKAPYRKEQTLLKHLPYIPLVENLLKDGTDGCALAALIHFYCPGVIHLEDVCLKETMSLADSLHNLQLIQQFCQEYLNHCCHFTLEDMIYSASSIKSNCLVFMAELFWWFEVVKPSFVQPRVVCPQGAECGKDVPSVPVLNVAKRNSVDSSSNSDFTSRYTYLQAHSSASGGIRASSVSYVDSVIGTWPNEKKTTVHGVSFDISFDEEGNAQNSTPKEGTMYYVSNKGLTLNNSHASKHIRKKLSYQSVNGEGTEEKLHVDSCGDFKFCVSLNTNELNSKKNTHYRLSNEVFQNTVLKDEFCNQIETQSIEETLQIIHVIEKSPYTPGPDQITNGFSLHSQDLNTLNSNIKLNNSSPDNITDTKGVLSRVTDATDVDTGIHVPSEDILETTDKNSSLRDYTINLHSDLNDAFKCLQDSDVKDNNPREALSPCPRTISTKSQPWSSASYSSGVKMTSFAEQKFRKLNPCDGESCGSCSQKTMPGGSELNIPHMVSWAQSPEETDIAQGRDSSQQLAFEMVHLKMRLEEKRCAIEAQKKKMQAVFTKERMKMGRTAFVTAMKQKGDGISPLREKATGTEDEKICTDRDKLKESQKNDRQKSKSLPDIKESMENPQGRWLKSPTMPVDPEKQRNLASLSEETLNEKEILEYTESIEKLNSSFHVLQQELQRLFLQQEMLMQMREKQSWGTSPPQPTPQKQIRDFKSRQAGLSSAAVPFPSDSPCPTHPSPQTSNRKSTYFSSKNQKTPKPNELKTTPLNRTLTPPWSVDSLPPRLRRFSPSQVSTQTPSFICFDDGGEPQLKDPKPKEEIKKESLEFKETLKPCNHNPEEKEIKPLESTVPEVLSQHISETVNMTPNKGQQSQCEDPPSKPVFPPSAPKNISLIPISLSHSKPPEKADVSVKKYDEESDKKQFGDDQKICCGFFVKDDHKAENDMAMKQVALLEKQLKKEKETQLQKQQVEAEMEQKKEETKYKTEKERQKKEHEQTRREFIKQEYMRWKQLKLMEDINAIIKPHPQEAKQRPKSIHRGHTESPQTPIKGPPVSRLSVALRNTGDKESIHTVKRTLKSESPSHCNNRNGEKDWENISTSSVASATEYTGPKLYKEPTAKSNRHIIQNALSHCCFAGKVNEVQKTKILEEMEKSVAKNFLILFRDSGCKFRALYTYYPETEEINKWTGIGPKTITKTMIEGIYKYNSDRKQFSYIPSKTLSASMDAITIHNHIWQTKRPATTKKLLPTKA